MRAINEIVFIRSPQPSIDRGWITVDAEKALQRLGYRTSEITINSSTDAKKIEQLQPGVIAWPSCYTIGPDPSSTLISAVLEELEIPFIGPSSRVAPLSSKLNFKQALANSDLFQTPRHVLLQNDDFLTKIRQFPLMLKTEYSCNSEGVAKLSSQEELIQKFREFSTSFQQRVFIENWLGGHEYTVSFLPANFTSEPIVSSLRMILMSDVGYIDHAAKIDDSLIRLARPSIDIADKLEKTTLRLSSALGLNCPFRVDVIVKDDEINLIELNLLPHLNYNNVTRSYLPVSFYKKTGMEYLEVISRIVESTILRQSLL